MASVLCSQGVVLATAMALSGTVILLAFGLQKSLPIDRNPQSSSQQALRSCISSEGKRNKKKKKKVHFAKDVVDPTGNGDVFRRQHSTIVVGNSSSSPSKYKRNGSGGNQVRGMPANRIALYNGMLRDRVVQRLTYSY